ncbi:unnamed protein product, partial [Coccothraustes coccothraustes]
FAGSEPKPSTAKLRNLFDAVRRHIEAKLPSEVLLYARPRHGGVGMRGESGRHQQPSTPAAAGGVGVRLRTSLGDGAVECATTQRGPVRPPSLHPPAAAPCRATGPRAPGPRALGPRAPGPRLRCPQAREEGERGQGKRNRATEQGCGYLLVLVAEDTRETPCR